MYVCLWSPVWSTGAASPRADDAGASGIRASGIQASGIQASGTGEIWTLVAALAPRVRVERDVVWADARGLDAGGLAARLVARLQAAFVRAGVAAVPVAAELAARFGRPAAGAGVPEAEGAGASGVGARGGVADRSGGETPFLVKERTGWGWRRRGRSEAGTGGEAGAVVVVERGREAAWMAGLPVTALDPDDRLRALLDGVGITRVGELAALEREGVEVRFGAQAVALWRLARADDRRRLFGPVPPERPHGSIDFVDYVLTDPARLLFTANALLGPVCERLTARGEHARALRLTLPLANGDEWARTLRPARPTASRETWLRFIRGVLDTLTVPDAVAGMRLEVVSTEAAAVHQGDLFDRGFATASAVEAAVARLAERQVVPLESVVAAHPLVERRAVWTPVPLERIAAGAPPRPGAAPADDAAMALQLLSAPRRVRVETVARRDHEAPVRLRDRGGWREIVLAAGPDRISGGQWEDSPYAREYYRCVTDEGVLLWLYRDGVDGGWYIHGYWD